MAFYAKPSSAADPTSSYHVNYDLRAAKSDTPEAFAAGTQLFDYNLTTNPNWSKAYGGGRSFMRVVLSFTPEEDGTYYFGFHIYDVAYGSNNAVLTLTGFDVEDYLAAVTPKAPQEFYNMYFKVAPDRKLEITLNWRLDTLDYYGNPIPEEITYKEVRVYRNNELAATLPGAPKTWTDTEELGLTPGVPSYRVEAVFSNGKATSTTETKSNEWVGPVDINTLPWTMPAIGQIDLKKDWLSVTGATEGASTTGWGKQGTTYLKYTPKNNMPDDSYLILPPFEMKEAGYCELVSTLKLGHASQIADGLEVYIAKGTRTTAAYFTEKVGTIMPPNTTEAEFFNTFYLAEPGVYTLAIRRYSPKSTTTSLINIKKLAINKGVLAPLPVADLKGEVVDEKAVLTWTNPTLDNTTGTLDKISKIDVVRFDNLGDTVIAATLTSGIEPGKAMTYTDAPEKPWVYNYMIRPYYDGGLATPKPMNAFEKEGEWIGSKVQTIPYAFDAKVGSHQETIVPAGKLWTMEKGTCTATANMSLISAGFQLSITKNKTMAYRLIAPPMNLKKGYYKVSIRMKGGYSDMDLNAGYMRHGDEERNVMNKAKFTTGAYSTAVRVLDPVAVKVDEDGLMDFVISIDGSTPASGSTGLFYIEMIAFDVMPITPGAATGLSVTPGADNALSATVAWTNPTTSRVEGDVPEITKVVLYRNGKAIATLTEGVEAGKAMTYTDTEIPTAGIYTYKVEVFTADGSNADATVASPWIGLGKDLPYVTDGYSEWTVPAGIGVIGVKAPIGGTLNIKNFSVKESPVVGVGSISADGSKVDFDGNDLRFASRASKVVVADLTGKVIRIAADVDRIDLRDLAKGVYIVSVTIDGRNVPVKIRK